MRYSSKDSCNVEDERTNNRLDTGRWHNIDRDDKICTLCNAGLIGDKFDYLLECTYFNDDRKNFLGENYCVRPNTMIYKTLMSTKMFMC